MYYKVRTSLDGKRAEEQVTNLRRQLAMMVLRSMLRTLSSLFRDSNASHTDQNRPAPSKPPFFGLPEEIILAIIDFLEPEEKLVLNMVSQRLRRIIHPTCNVARCGIDSRVKYLHLLEPDYPDHLVCAHCGVLWNWRSRVPDKLHCPRQLFHCDAYPWQLQGTGPGQMSWIKPGVIELIMRAQRRGARYGLPLSVLDGGSSTDHDRTTWTHQARIVQSDIILASRRETYLRTDQNGRLKKQHLAQDLCIHTRIKTKVWTRGGRQPLEAVVAAAAQSARIPQNFKCSRCDSDFELCCEQEPGGDLRATLRIWRRFGHRRMFQLTPKEHLDDAAIAGRDIQALFESMDEDLDPQQCIWDTAPVRS